MGQITTINPATGQIIKGYAEMGSRQIAHKIDHAQTAFADWSERSVSFRTGLLGELAAQLVDHKRLCAQTISQEMGKPITAALSEVEKCVWLCRHFAEYSPEYLKPIAVKTEFYKSYVTYEPLGVILAIEPWNFPFWQILRMSVPTIMAGNVVMVKPAPITTGCGYLIEKLFKQAGFANFILQTVVMKNEVAAKTLQMGNLQGVAFTGSAQAGAQVAAVAGSGLKKMVIELGGNDPYLILADADLNKAVGATLASRLSNSGQVCIAAKRIIVVDAIYEDFKAKLLKEVARYSLGDPQEESTQLGPLAREDLREQVHKQVQQTIKQGAQCLLGAKMPSGRGFYYPITVLDGIEPGMIAFEEEIFGPVISLIRAKNETQAIALANDSKYGLAAAVFTNDLLRGEEIAAKKLQAGLCFVNSLVSSDPRLPFGGIKMSGFGRESGIEGVRGFTNVKTVVVKNGS